MILDDSESLSPPPASSHSQPYPLSPPQRFSANGQPYQLQHSDYLGGKGLGLARLHTPAGAVDLYVSHLHGDYSRAKGSKDPDR